MTAPSPFHRCAAPEPSSQAGFAGGRLDRRSEGRDEAMVSAAKTHPGRRTYAFAGNRLVLRGGEPLLDDAALTSLDPMEAETALLGFDGAEGDAPRFAVPVGADPDTLPPGFEASPLRPLLVAGEIAADRMGAIALGASLLAWIGATRHCGRCGTPTTLQAGGMRRECPACSLKQFPRTDPVAIMLPVSTDGTRCILGRSPHFPEGMVSCLAGFIEPGETIEAAVRRETGEEAGVDTGRVRYLASQPWPMPHSLMIGCLVEASGPVRFDQTELEACRWYERSEIEAILDGIHEHSAPPPGAIANLILRLYLQHTQP